MRSSTSTKSGLGRGQPAEQLAGLRQVTAALVEVGERVGPAEVVLLGLAGGT